MAIAVEGYKVANGSSGSGGAISVTHGLTIASGDVLVAFIGLNYNANTADNNGAAAFTEDYDWADTVNGLSHSFYTRVAGSSEPSAYAWTTTAWINWTAIILQLSGVDTDDIWDVAPSDSTRDGSYSSTITADSQTTTADGALALFCVHGLGQNVTDPTNSFGDGVGQNTTAPKLWVFRKSIASAGAIGSTAATLATTQSWRCHLLALTPGAAEPPATTFLPHIMRHYFIPELGGH